MPAGILPVNHNLSVIAADPGRLEDLALALQSDEAQAWVAARAPRLENGYLSITTNLLRELPVSIAALAAA